VRQCFGALEGLLGRIQFELIRDGLRLESLKLDTADERERFAGFDGLACRDEDLLDPAKKLRARKRMGLGPQYDGGRGEDGTFDVLCHDVAGSQVQGTPGVRA